MCTRACGLQKQVSAAEADLATEEKAISAFTKAEGAQKATEATVSPGCPSVVANIPSCFINCCVLRIKWARPQLASILIHPSELFRLWVGA